MSAQQIITCPLCRKPPTDTFIEAVDGRTIFYCSDCITPLAEYTKKGSILVLTHKKKSIGTENRRLNQKGSALLQAVIITGIMIIATGIVTAYVINSNGLNILAEGAGNATNYAKYGIEEFLDKSNSNPDLLPSPIGNNPTTFTIQNPVFDNHNNPIGRFYTTIQPETFTSTTTTAAIGTTTLSVNPITGPLKGDDLIIIKTATQKFMAKVQTYANNTITLKTPLPYNVPANTPISTRTIKIISEGEAVNDLTLTTTQWWTTIPAPAAIRDTSGKAKGYKSISTTISPEENASYIYSLNVTDGSLKGSWIGQQTTIKASTLVYPARAAAILQGEWYYPPGGTYTRQGTLGWITDSQLTKTQIPAILPSHVGTTATDYLSQYTNNDRSYITGYQFTKQEPYVNPNLANPAGHPQITLTHNPTTGQLTANSTFTKTVSNCIRQTGWKLGYRMANCTGRYETGWNTYNWVPSTVPTGTITIETAEDHNGETSDLFNKPVFSGTTIATGAANSPTLTATLTPTTTSKNYIAIVQDQVCGAYTGFGARRRCIRYDTVTLGKSNIITIPSGNPPSDIPKLNRNGTNATLTAPKTASPGNLASLNLNLSVTSYGYYLNFSDYVDMISWSYNLYFIDQTGIHAVPNGSGTYWNPGNGVTTTKNINVSYTIPDNSQGGWFYATIYSGYVRCYPCSFPCSRTCWGGTILNGISNQTYTATQWGTQSEYSNCPGNSMATTAPTIWTASNGFPPGTGPSFSAGRLNLFQGRTFGQLSPNEQDTYDTSISYNDPSGTPRFATATTTVTPSGTNLLYTTSYNHGGLTGTYSTTINPGTGKIYPILALSDKEINGTFQTTKPQADIILNVPIPLYLLQENGENIKESIINPYFGQVYLNGNWTANNQFTGFLNQVTLSGGSIGSNTNPTYLQVTQTLNVLPGTAFYGTLSATTVNDQGKITLMNTLTNNTTVKKAKKQIININN